MNQYRSNSSYPGKFGFLSKNAKLYFTADQLGAGRELFEYDTLTSQLRLIDIFPGYEGSSPNLRDAASTEDGEILFYAEDSLGNELRALSPDGEISTIDINSGSGDSFPVGARVPMAVWDNNLYLLAQHDGSNRELTKVNLLEHRAAEIALQPGATEGFTEFSTIHASSSGQLFIAARSKVYGDELFKYDPNPGRVPPSIHPEYSYELATELVSDGVADFGFAVANVGDVNGDGVDDLAVGSPSGDAGRGAVYVYSGADNSVLRTLTGDGDSNLFGVEVSAAGDLNGDGYADIVVGDDQYQTNYGRVHAFSGVDGSELFTYAGNYRDELGVSLSPISDVNGDGYDDVIVGARRSGVVTVLGGGAPTNSASPGKLGEVVFTITDTGTPGFGAEVLGLNSFDVVDDERYPRLMVAATSANSAKGKVSVYSSAPGRPFVSEFNGDTDNTYFGTRLFLTDDANGDGVRDVLVGTYAGSSGSGFTRLVDGQTGETIREYRSEATGELFGIGLSGIGDFNFDGTPDIAVGAPNAGGGGRIDVFSGAPDKALLASFGSPELNAEYGWTLTTVPDRNGDGIAELVVGAPNAAKVYVLQSEPKVLTIPENSPVGTVVTDLAATDPDSTQAELTWSIPWSSHPGAFAIDDSGIVTVADSGLLDYEAAQGHTLQVQVEDETGKTDIIQFAIELADVQEAPILVLENAYSLAGTISNSIGGTDFGYSVAIAGDVNRDGINDYIVGAAGADEGRGAAYVYSGADDSLIWTLKGDSESGQFGTVVSGAGDLNNDGYADLIVGDDQYLINHGRVHAFSGKDGGELYTVEGQPGEEFGVSLSAYADYNGDRLDDFLVGTRRGGRAVLISGIDGELIQSFTGLSDASPSFGITVGALDVDNEFPLVVIGDTGATTSAGANAGRVQAFEPQENEEWYRVDGDTANGYFGIRLQMIASVNNDHIPELLVGSYGSGGALGYVKLVEGEGGDVLSTYRSNDANDLFGLGHTAVGDFNADGTEDIAVGVPGMNGGSGRVDIYSSDPSGQLLTSFAAPVAAGEFGLSLATLPDRNGDGVNELLIGAPNISTVYVYESGVRTLSVSESAPSNSPVTRLNARDPESGPTSLVWTIISGNEGGAFSIDNQGVIRTANTESIDYETRQAFALVVEVTDPEGASSTIAVHIPVIDVPETPSIHPEYSYELATELVSDGVSDFGFAVANVGDVNGDGVDDLAVGSPSGDAGRGAVHVYSGADNSVLRTLTGDGDSNLFGVEVSAAGDLNGDGYADIIVGDDQYLTNYGRVHAFSGVDGSELFTYAGGFRDELGVSLSPINDVNGDGYDDVIVGARRSGVVTVLGGGDPSNTNPGRLGESLFTITDTGTPGFGIEVLGLESTDDSDQPLLMVAATSDDSGRGKVRVYSSGSGRPLISEFNGDTDNTYFGARLFLTDDANGDGVRDVLVGTYAGSSGSGFTRVVDGQTGETIREYRSEATGELFGIGLSGIGDFNFDGTPDIAVGAPNAGGGGRIDVFSGAPDKALLASFGSPELNAEYGWTLTTVPDRNGDGIAELVVGAPNAAKVYVLQSEPKVLSIPENPATGILVTRLSATDPDTTVESIAWTITAGNESGAFSVAAGVLTVADGQAVDFEETSEFNLTIEASDPDGKRDTIDLVVTVRDENDTALFFGDTAASLTVDPAGDPVEVSGTVGVFDQDAGQANLVAQTAVTTTYGTLGFLSAAGEWQYTLDPNNPAVTSLSAGGILTDSIEFYSLDGTAGSLVITILGEDDGDGVSDAIEAGVPGGDGNGDGIADNEQDNVASLPNAESGSYVTIASDQEITNVRATQQPSEQVDLPENVSFPIGFVQFTVPAEPAGQIEQVTLHFDPSENFNSVYKFGPTPDNPEPHYYEFTFDAVTGTGAQFFPGYVVLNIRDGGRGDSDGIANGRILDPVALAVVPRIGDDYVQTNEDNSLTFDSRANDRATGDLTVTETTSPENGTVIINDDGTLTYSPNLNYFGPDSFVYTVTDAIGQSGEATVFVEVDAVNDPPVLSIEQTEVVTQEGSSPFVPFSVSDVDALPNEDLQITSSVGSIGAYVIGSEVTFHWDYVPTDDDAQVVTITATDAQGGVAEASFNLVVENVAPTATLTPTTVVSKNNSAEVTFNFEDIIDPGEDTHRVSYALDPADLAGDYDSASEGASPAFEFAADTTSTVHARIFDDDGGSTTYAFDVIVGTRHADSLIGTGRSELIIGLGGNDTIDARSGNDFVYAGGGNDDITGGKGRDFIDAGNGNDRIYFKGTEAQHDTPNGGGGYDRVINTAADSSVRFEAFLSVDWSIEELQLAGGQLLGTSKANTLDFTQAKLIDHAGISSLGGDDTIFASRHTHDVTYDGGSGDDKLNGANRNDILLGGTGADTILGGGGNDTIDPGKGHDTVDAGNGNDRILVQDNHSEFDTLVGGGGYDRILSQGAGTPRFDNLLTTDWSIEELGASDAAVPLNGIVGNSQANTLDLSNARLPSNQFSVRAGGGDDVITASRHTADVLYLGESGDDTLDGQNRNDQLFGGPGNDQIRGGGGNDQLYGGKGVDNIDGGNGNDTIFVLRNDDEYSTLLGGGGYDRIQSDNPAGNLRFGELDTNAQSIEEINASGHSILGNSSDNHFDFSNAKLTDVLSILGGGGNDTIIASRHTHDVVYDGESGDDTLQGQNKRDQLFGGVGDDILFGGGNNDLMSGGKGLNTLTGDNGNDRFLIDKKGKHRIEDFDHRGNDMMQLEASLLPDSRPAEDYFFSTDIDGDGEDDLRTDLKSGTRVELTDQVLARLGADDFDVR